MNTAVIFDSLGGNTGRVALAIRETVERHDLPCAVVKVNGETEFNFFDYDLVFIGSPVIDWLPTRRMMDFVKNRMTAYNRGGLIKPASPLVPGKFGVCFGTFAGPHIGEREARPMTMWLDSFLGHLGFSVLDHWHVPGAFSDPAKEAMNRCGRLGDIRNRPNDNDLADIGNRVAGILSHLEAWTPPGREPV